MVIEVPAVVRNKARAAGAEDWLERLPTLVSSLEADWSIAVGRPFAGGSEAFVAEANWADGTSVVLKVLVPGAGNDPSNEATVLRHASGKGCPSAPPRRAYGSRRRTAGCPRVRRKPGGSETSS